MGSWGEAAERPADWPAPTRTPVTVRRPVRPVEGRVWRGVCAGLADFAGVDPVVVRVATVVAFAALGPVVLVAYLVARFSMPSGRSAADVPRARTRRRRAGAIRGPVASARLAGWAMVATGAWLLLARIGVSPAALAAVACVGLGANLLLRPRTR